MTSPDLTTAPTPPASDPSRPGRRLDFGSFWDTWGITSVLVLLVLVAVATTPDFLAISNLQSILRESAYLGIVACAMTVLIINGAFDLSVGGQLALVSVLTLFAYGVGGTGLAVVTALAAGTACGMVNGFLVTALRVPPFVATLGMLFVFRGIAYLLTQNGPATLPYTEVDSPFAQIGSLNLALVPFPFVLMVVVFGLAYVLLRRTPTGRRIVAFGSSPVAARFSGVSAARIRFVVFALVGLAVGIATLTYITRVWTADGAAQDGFELSVITAAVLGGASLQGGRGSLVGTFSAVLLVTVLNDVLVAHGVDASYQNIILGTVLIIALAIDGLRTRFAGVNLLRRSFGPRTPKAA
ncbi:ABC transporter permease [Cellulosimicrobium arenosum]|uniref:Autoinducer 2 import system permease protein LsrD n=1 Tax=Cellulosimicrobium arenosum TaxID=2708133 RepID=A0A927J0Y8_9MICO|nr:ABC transporter permease [Cellulosimicrobium arenosum]MBD8079867.1 ABC transporter permease [Cellulosimicrobium arenosum]